MKKLLVLLVLVFGTGSLLNAQEVEWYSWEEGYAKAQEENKTMLVFVQANWCHWCKRMIDKTFNKEEVSSVINMDYIAVIFDVDKEETYTYNGKNFEGKMLLGELSDNKCQGIPSTIFINTKTSTGLLEEGFKTPEEMGLLLVKHNEKS